eukprot:181334-Alexandrium_andersonii.AAC.1
MFLLKSEAVRVLAKVANRFGAWCGGCPCHEDILISTPHLGKRRKLMLATKTVTPEGLCPWKGKRGPEMAAGKLSFFLQCMREASSTTLTQMLAIAQPEHARHIIDFMASVRERVVATWTA